MQISISQAYFFQFFIKSNKIKNILEIGTFTGYSALSMGLVLPKDGKITCLDINKKTSEEASLFFYISEIPVSTPNVACGIGSLSARWGCGCCKCIASPKQEALRR